MASREILTIQLGHYANFVGTHWWNIQESNFSYDPNNPSEIDPDVFFREGRLGNKSTYTPRLLLADLKGTLGYLSEEGNINDILENPSNLPVDLLWDENKIEKIVEPAAEKSLFVQNLDSKDTETIDASNDLENENNKWVDYLYTRYNQRTVNVVTEYEHKSETTAFETFPCGQNLWKTDQFQNDFIERIRNYVEECNMMQGFQVLMDADNGFGGLSAACIEYLRDEYGKSIIAWPVLDSVPRQKSLADYAKIINMVVCWKHLNENSSLFSPLCCDFNGWPVPNNPRKFENIVYKPELKYHTSALMATALDTLSIRYRNRKYASSVLSDLCADLNKLGRKAVATSLSVPFPMNTTVDFIDVLDNLDGRCPWESLTPYCKIDQDCSMHSVSLRGIPEDRLKRPLKDAANQMNKAGYRCSTVHEMMSLYLDSSCIRSGIHLTNTERPMIIKNPYPKIFESNVQQSGFLSDSPRPNDTNVATVPVMAGLHSGKFVADMYHSLHENVRKIRSINRFHSFADSGLEQDEFEECIHNLLDCKENYEEHDY
ncbi:protein misato [Trichogramma pretiosum]|uniref:protein misato n=1 Tax=Trichogramma pretiosum TaxID=7493 RepID=UPI0006C9AFEF|nr:protein misato [Trichogramma pretiosum]